MILESLVLVATLLAGPQSGSATPAAPTPASAAEPRAGLLPVSVDRIRDALSTEPLIKPDLVNPVFRVEVIGKKPTIEDLLGKEFWKGGAGPTPGGSVMTHQEFLAMVTPPEFRGTAMFTQGEAITVVATGAALQWALQRAIRKYNSARHDNERAEARREVQEALAALHKARAAAGLPPKAP